MIEKKITTFFETIQKETPQEVFEALYDKNVMFKDPFNQVKGVDAVYTIFSHMYQNLENPRFKMIEYLHKENIAYVKWAFHFKFKGEKKPQSFEGVSRLEINKEHKIISHIDYWDAGEHIYEKMPLIGYILRYIKQKIAQR